MGSPLLFFYFGYLRNFQTFEGDLGLASAFYASPQLHPSHLGINQGVPRPLAGDLPGELAAGEQGIEGGSPALRGIEKSRILEILV